MILQGYPSPSQANHAHARGRVCRVAERTGQSSKNGVKMFDMRFHRAAVLVTLVPLATLLPGLAEQRMVSVGDRHIAVYCDGEPTRFPTVILVPAGGRTAKDWDTIQPKVARFARVCSYDHANFGQSDRALVRLQSIDEVVDDLQGWLQASREKGPFVLVGHSNSGIYVRRFETRYTQEVAGLVFLDSAHEEQALRLHELDPIGPAPDEVMARVGWYTKPGQQLEWQTRVPLIVIGRGTPFERTARDGSNSQTDRMTDEQFPRTANIASQKGVATGSKETSRNSSFKQFAMSAGWRVPADRRFVTTRNFWLARHPQV